MGRLAATRLQVEPSGLRSTLKPVSFVALSFQARLIWPIEIAVAVRFVGGLTIGAGTIVPLTVYRPTLP